MGARRSLVVTTPLALALACAADIAMSRAIPDARALAGLCGLIVALGILGGALWEGAFSFVARLPSRIVALIWSAYGIGCGLLLALRLGAFSHLHGRYHRLALELLVACALLAAGFAVFSIAMSPSRSWPLGYAVAAPTRTRIGLAILLAALAACCIVADDNVLVGLYPDAHLALRLAYTWLMACALALFMHAPEDLPRYAGWFGSACVAGGLALAQIMSAHFSSLAGHRWPESIVDAARALTDVDRDGYSSLFAGGDCAPFDPKVSPGAAEIPNNGVDDNCLAGDAKTIPPRAQTLVAPKDASPIDVVLITVDSLRLDTVGVYCTECGQNGLATTPQIDAFARSALVFDNAYAAGGWTAISISALMRGVYPRRLDWTRMFETSRYRLLRSSERGNLVPDESLVKMFAMPLSDVHASLAGWLGQRGMKTIAVADDGYSDLLSPVTNVAPGFDTYRQVNAGESSDHDDRDTADIAMSELSTAPTDRHLFMWVHFFGPHNPSERHDGVRYDGAATKPAYEHEVRYADMHVGRLLQAIEARGAPTAVFVTADHGEEFIAGDRHHGWSLEQEAIRVPFIAKVPTWNPGHAAMPITLVDLMPTILSLTGTPLPTDLDGVSIADVIQEASPASQRWLLADTWQYDGHGAILRDEATALDGKTKAIHDAVRDSWTLVDLTRSPLVTAPTQSRADSDAVRVLAKYLESTTGPSHVHD